MEAFTQIKVVKVYNWPFSLLLVALVEVLLVVVQVETFEIKFFDEG